MKLKVESIQKFLCLCSLAMGDFLRLEVESVEPVLETQVVPVDDLFDPVWLGHGAVNLLHVAERLALFQLVVLLCVHLLLAWPRKF